ncbi:MAG: Spo0B domain-containing protein [Thermoflavifilum sp.]|nr:Spo0B domain-containing protein [Thermoflavifilum sp.]MCL6513980.1 Spo0B domain-containing protein [Alicyclobacillus sp.]
MPSLPSPQEAFRRHRHDVLNELQLIRAYIQMGRTGSALQVVDRLAAWLGTLSQWQTAFPTQPETMWCASQCPHLRLVACEGPVGQGDIGRLCEAWLWLDEAAAAAGCYADVALAWRPGEGYELLLHPAEETRGAWETILTSAPAWPGLRVALTIWRD